MASYGPTKRLRNHQFDLRDMLLTAGVGQFNAVMSIPYMNMLPATTDPYAQGVMQIVRGLQRLLNKRGAKVIEDGGMGPKTVLGVALYAGPRWQDKSWAQLYGDVIAGEKWPGWKRHGRSPTNENMTGLSGDRWDYSRAEIAGLSGDPISDLLSNPLVLAAGGFFVWWKFFRKPSRKGGNGSEQKLLPAGELEDL
jgi:hypothetical protein